MSDKVVKKFVVRAERAIVEHLIYDVEAYSEEEARLQVEHNSAILFVRGQERKHPRRTILDVKITSCHEVKAVETGEV